MKRNNKRARSQRKIKQIFFVVIAIGFFIASFIVFKKPSEVVAQCADGYTCAEWRTYDLPDGCNYYTYYCTQHYNRISKGCDQSRCEAYFYSYLGSCSSTCQKSTFSRWVNCCVVTQCTCSSWANVGGCGEGTCNSTERKQTRNCTPDGCSSEARCVYSSACDIPTPSCSVSLDPSTVNISQGTDANYIATVTVGSGSIDYVSFSSNNPAVATIDPASDASQPYQTTGDTLSIGSTTITANVVMSGSTRCSDTAVLNVTAPGPWWQVIDADIVTNGDIISSIPTSCALPGCNPLLGLEGLGGFPGVPVYGGSDLNTGEGDVSTLGWQANADTMFSKTYDYSFFGRLIRPDVVLTEIDSTSVNGGFFTSGGAPSRGFVWYHFDGDALGDLTVASSVNMPGDRKVVVLVENADLYIEDVINVVDGEGFMMFIVGKDGSGNKGNIYIDENVSHPVKVEVEGVFLAEGQFRTGAGSEQLHIRGMVAAYDGVVLERDLEGDNIDTPAEIFEFAPDFILAFPRDLTYKRLRWKEVAP